MDTEMQESNQKQSRAGKTNCRNIAKQGEGLDLKCHLPGEKSIYWGEGKCDSVTVDPPLL